MFELAQGEDVVDCLGLMVQQPKGENISDGFVDLQGLTVGLYTGNDLEDKLVDLLMLLIE